ncbi:prepilin-type N-terminal cleavage/methylation domain-containing protein [Thioflavicoccus mobilis 8321]|uniref:Prepilin-type N-terminal cleavage/methylation domain-containing protein n=1 Tax=Thioflavicoccus mobilis 8321 TaxID=765912 RepID=L0GUJ8_9GAMM|nr:prepilin-type N-terminal cleavage/methylation domain-containing protein [Thioflavicoccus mobilis]AGA89482.1 prepilin-type N-terminal cleavage/methylation domain-containing protein [Thioflavicoccus mobilis 8321]
MQYTHIAKLANRIQKRRARRGQKGFTLLELLVVVAILAAIAGTAAIALQDTDARASAAAHVAMMDELNKGIHTYRVLNKNSFPDNFDSMLEIAGGAHPFTATTGAAVAASLPAGDLIGVEDVGTLALTVNAAGILNDIGIEELQYLNNGAAVDLDGDGVTTDCESVNIQDTIASRANAVVGGNVFLTPDANGCGVAVPIGATDQVLVWTGGYERLIGSEGVVFDQAGATAASGGPGTAIDGSAVGNPVWMIVGIGPSSTLFNTRELGGMTTVPVYRHVTETQYQRFAALFEIGTWTSTDGTTYDAADQVTLVGIIDGAGDTKEEELGEWDGTRNTI